MAEHSGTCKKGSEGQTIYAAFHMSRERYTRIIRGEAVRFSRKELERLLRETGVRSEIFEGKTAFEFEAISRKEWQRLFDLREEDIKKARDYEKNLYAQMKKSDAELLKNPDLYYFAVYLKNGKAAVDRNIEAELKDLIQQLNDMGLAQLEQCGLEVLREYLRELERQKDIAGTPLYRVKAIKKSCLINSSGTIFFLSKSGFTHKKQRITYQINMIT